MQKSTSGFTIVELIVIVVVVGIIAAIAVVSYGSYKTSTINQQRIAEIRGWRATFERYWAANGEYPAPSEEGNHYYCLGTGFPDGVCSVYHTWNEPHKYTTEAASAYLMDALAPYDPPPPGPRVEVSFTGINPPLAYYTEYNLIKLTTVLEFPGQEHQECPSDMTLSGTQDSTSGTGVKKRAITCHFALTR